MLSMVANRRADPQLGDEHILIKPDFPEDLGFASWERHNEVFLHAYREVVSSIRARMTEDDPKMLALIGPGVIAASYRKSIVASAFQPLPILVELHIIGRVTT